VSDARLQRSLRATFVGLGVNTLLSGIKLAAGIMGHSGALVADGIESLADIFSSLVVWRGVVVAAEPADEDHPYGHGKAEPIAAATVCGMLLAAAGWIVMQAAHDIATPHQPPAPFTLLILLAVIVIKETLFRYVIRESAAAESSAVHTDAWHHRSDVISSICAAIGISIALLGGPGYAVADDYAAIAAACIIGWNGWRLLRPALNELMDRTPSTNLSGEIQRVAEKVGGVDKVEKCFVRKMGNQYYADMHVQVDPQMTVERSHDIAHEVKDLIRDAMPNVRDVLVHIEPSRRRNS
jgi:cation diffusion facilitator family transporter